MPLKPTDISHVASHALRHAPGEYGLVLDAEGWVAVDELLAAMRRLGSKWSEVDAAALDNVIATSAKKRFEIRDGRIRAMYGHSVAEEITHAESAPPNILFHGTSPAAWEAIRLEGLRPMNRQNVHLSQDVETAIMVGRRKAPKPIILVVRALDAHAAGTRFFFGNDTTWLADPIAAEFVSPYSP